MGGIKVKPCRHGLMMYYVNDAYIGRSLDHYSEYSEDEIRLWAQIVRPGWTALDIGANIGAHTVWMAKQVGPTGRVVAVEPQRQLFQMMVGNLALNELGNVSTLMGACGPAIGSANVPHLDYTKENNFGGLSLKLDKLGEAVPMVPIDGMGLKACHFVKIDVEGMELDVLRGAGETIAKHKPIIYVENDREADSPALIEHIMKSGYRLFWHMPELSPKQPFSGEAGDLFPGVVGVNMLCIHASLQPNISGLREIRTPQDISGVAL